ncbi:MAG: DUF89 family protein [Deltaproteobacteria bacterium]|nr:DUF89 family protein [Deltaproteobacteria bacterium]MBW2052832.1 DUF89 family protein [Deltaproteobacteria bacterium]MBW2142253.1 DUF89 family protein [Deltaproteobacteria bacterium]MBW2324550.1 DUF89 family protein [Deltaproteobacteria bacterium]
MKSKPDCIACMFKQALNTARFVTDDPEVQRKVLFKVAEAVAGMSLETSPAILSRPAYDAVTEITGVRDPYKQAKAATNEEVLSLVPRLQEIIDQSADPIEAGLHLAAAGNLIDFGIGHQYDLMPDIEAILRQGFVINAFDDFKNELKPGVKLLYLGDNAGEIVLDRLFIELLKKTGVDITFSVKSGPIINDATMEDAEFSGMTSVVKVIETGSDDIGVNWDRTSKEFLQAFESADVIISKGQGNFETCSARKENIYFLLKAKCEAVARELGVNEGDIVFKRGRR